MRYNVLKITTIHAMLIAVASLTMLACPEPEPEKSTTDTSNKTDTTSFTVTFNLMDGKGNIPPLTVSKGKTAANPTAPTKDKLTFGIWTRNARSPSSLIRPLP